MLVSPAGSTIWEKGGLGSFRNWDLAEESGVVEIGLESQSLAPFPSSWSTVMPTASAMCSSPWELSFSAVLTPPRWMRMFERVSQVSLSPFSSETYKIICLHLYLSASHLSIGELGIKSTESCLLGKCSTTELCPLSKPSFIKFVSLINFCNTVSKT